MATEVHVGGRLEAVAPRPVTDPGDRVRLLALVAVAAAVHVWVLTHTAVTARDSIGFARTALQFQDPKAAGLGDVVGVLKNEKQPPGYPLAVLATSQLVRVWYHPAVPDPLPDQMLLSCQVASCVAGILLVFPSYWLGRLLFGKFVGFAGALMFQVLPAVAVHTSDGLTEGLYLLGVGTALALGVRAVKKPNVGGFLLCGLATGVSYLVRPEGVLAAGAVGLVAAGLTAARRWAVPQGAARLTALGVGVVLPAIPYMVLIGGVSNKPSIDNAFQRLIGNPRQQLLNKKSGAAPAGGPLFAAWYDSQRDGPLPAWVAKAVVQETAKGFHYVPAGLAVLGLLVSARRMRPEPWLRVPVVFGGLMLLALAGLGYGGQQVGEQRIHYLSERHTLSVVFVGCFFAAYGLEELPRLLCRLPGVGGWLGRPAVTPIVLVAVVASCLPAVLRKSLHDQKAGHVSAGRYLGERLGADDALIDPYDWAGYYAGRTLRSIPPDPPDARVVYAVVEGGKDDEPHSALPRRKAALDVANDGRSVLVYHWPEDAPPEKAKVMVYRLDRGPSGK